MADRNMRDMVFDIVGTYFIKTYWNALYNDAIDNFKDPNTVYTTMEESYIASVDRYTRAFSRKQNPDEKVNRDYIAIIKDLHSTAREYLPKVGTIADFIDLVAKQFIHPDYLSAMGHQSEYKTGIFRRVLSQALAKFSIFITEEEIEIVLDDRDNWESNLKYWRGKFIEILKGERDMLTKLFLAERHGVKVETDDHVETVPKEVCLNMQKKMQESLVRIQELEHTINKYVDYINTLKDIVSSKDRTLQNLVMQLQQHGIMDEHGQIVYKPPRRRKSPTLSGADLGSNPNQNQNSGRPPNSIQFQNSGRPPNSNQFQNSGRPPNSNHNGQMNHSESGDETGDNGDNGDEFDFDTPDDDEKIEQVEKMGNVVKPIVTAQYSDDDFDDSDHADPHGVEITAPPNSAVAANDSDDSEYEDLVPDE